MSENISIFVGDDPSIEECRRIVEDHFDASLRRSSEENDNYTAFECEISGVFINIFDNHNLEDNCGIEFTRFPLEIDFTSYAGNVIPRWEEAPFLSRIFSLAEKLAQRFRARCIVVRNLQQTVCSIDPPSCAEGPRKGTGAEKGDVAP